MDNAAHYLKQLETSSKDLGRSFSLAGLQGYMASAMYVASSDIENTVFAITHSGGTPKHFERADKHIYHRRLSADQSMAAEVFSESKASATPSKMFPDKHLCINLPIQSQTDQQPDFYTKGLLQVVFDTQIKIKPNDIKRHIESNTMFQALPSIVKPLLSEIDENRDTFFNVRDSYTANAAVMFFDISGFTEHSSHLGYYRAQEFADKFCQNFMKQMSNEHGANLLRYEGDGLWLEMPIDDYASNETRKKIGLQALSMAQDTIEKFSEFAKDQDKGFEDAKLKVVIELGEVRDYHWEASNNNITSKPNDRSGPVFSNIRYTTEHMADRDNHDILLGPELKAILEDKNIYDISPRNFQHFKANEL